MLQGAIIKIGAGLLAYVVNNMSGSIRTEVISFIKRLEMLAKKTDNPIDDLLVDLVKAVLEID